MLASIQRPLMPYKSFRQELKKYYQSHDTLPKILDDEDIQSQNLSDYYVKLQIALSKQDQRDKKNDIFSDIQKIELEGFFNKMGDTNPDVSKVLVIGAAGVGKTTLMHYASYSWSKGDLWKGKFDFVIRVRLKDLLDGTWKKPYEEGGVKSDLENYPLASFIHSNTKNQSHKRLKKRKEFVL